MRRLKRFLRNWFGFSRVETNGFLILLPLMFIALFSQPAYQAWYSTYSVPAPPDSLELIHLEAAFRRSAETESLAGGVVSPGSSSREKFDPNTVSIVNLEKMGLSAVLAKRIAGYRAKGGVFRVKSDLLKIYGMDSSFYRRVSHLVDLPDSIGRPQLTSQKKQPRQLKKIDLNIADTIQLEDLPGIGPKLSRRIVNFRESLGGFVSVDQLREVYGLDSVVVNKIIGLTFVDPKFKPRCLDVNEAKEEELARHPYVRRELARAIINFRFQHGRFERTEDIQKLHNISPQQAKKLIPYLAISD